MDTPGGEGQSRCHFCGTRYVLLGGIGITLGADGGDYAFCEGCLKAGSAYEFWRGLLDDLGYGFPTDEGDEGPGSGEELTPPDVGGGGGRTMGWVVGIAPLCNGQGAQKG